MTSHQYNKNFVNRISEECAKQDILLKSLLLEEKLGLQRIFFQWKYIERTRRDHKCIERTRGDLNFGYHA